MYVKTRAACLAVLAGAVLLPASPAFAGETEPLVATAIPAVRTQAVSYADLDLKTEEAVDQLGTRVRRAARNVCDYHKGVQPLSEVVLGRECFDDAMERAGRDIEIAVAAARSGDQLASRGSTGSIAVRSE